MNKRCCRLNDKFFPIVFLLMLLVSSLFASRAYCSELSIGVIPEQNVFDQIKRYRLLGQYIENRTGIRINFTLLSGYGNIIDSFKDKNLDGAFWGDFTGALAIKQLGIQPVARQVDLSDIASHKGYIFVHKYSVIKNPDRMKDSVIAFVDRATTAGYVFPLAYLKQNGMKNMEGFFRKYYFTGSEEASVYAVLNKEADIGCAKSTVFDTLALNDPLIKENLFVTAASPEVPSNALGLAKEIPLAVKEAIKRTLLEMKDNPEGRDVLSKFNASRFTDTTEKDYEHVFDIAARAGIALNTYSYFNE